MVRGRCTLVLGIAKSKTTKFKIVALDQMEADFGLLASYLESIHLNFLTGKNFENHQVQTFTFARADSEWRLIQSEVTFSIIDGTRL